MGSRLSNGEVMRGIFIKHILEDSPAGQNGTLKTGDRIVEVRWQYRLQIPSQGRLEVPSHILYPDIVHQVDGVDLRDASHEEAVEAIRKAGNTVTFLVQSIVNKPRVSQNYSQSFLNLN